ncbi:ParB/RepB/Spo0J family partition protein [Odoribacter laneus]|uniref:DNA phosphorothioation-dependent restriction protein DptG n=1 Tax=Odoribacter laneus YIT 12061 TaxID=742817 RepID=H1DEG5_9BACT|nr:ParB/RepB/Spo0J family partition protein [Odoribacter laneus]EHP50062.1 DNA phosphorothioation-dependent restriction protein DptG [Odoribacter laneus YIT 12061]
MKTREERIEYIRKSKQVAEEDSSNKNYYTIKQWRGKPLHRKILSIDSEFLMFRIENSRTEIQQLAYIRKKALSKDFFNDPESYYVQEAQEEILLEMVRTKGKDLLEDLKTRKQDDPCIITYDGFLVNGNRRTAALKYLDERYIDCVVLPEDTTPRDIYALEQQLQISQDFREEYHWINELRNIRRGTEELGFTEKELASNLRLEIRELRIKLRILDLIDAFLLWKNLSGAYDYSKLDDAKEVFQQLEKAIKKYNDSVTQSNLRNAVFTLIEKRPSAGRVYNYVMALIKHFDDVCLKIKEKQKVDNTVNSKANSSGESSLIDGLIGEDFQGEEMFDNSEHVDETANLLTDTIADVQAENKEKRDAEAVYNGVSNALRELHGLIIDQDTAKLDSVKMKLREIISVATSLLSEIDLSKD